MLTESNKIVMIDDKEEDLSRLSQVFYNKGIGCKQIIYDPLFAFPLKGVRLLFLDINLNNAQSEQQRNSTLKDAITRYIHEDNGPYVLVLWTTNIEWIESFKSFVQRDNDENFIKHSPFYIANIDKTELLTDEKFEDKISQIFGDSAVKLIFEYENIMSDVVDQTISKLINLIPKGNVWENNVTFDENCKKVFSSIAIQTTGYPLAKENPDYAIKEALIPILSNAFRHSQKVVLNSIFFDELKKSSRNTFQFPRHFKTSKLNKLFNIHHCENITRETRGAVCPILLGNNDDLERDIFKDKFGYTANEWSKLTLAKNVPQEEFANIKIICVEFSAACDFSQQKKRTHKYLLGIIISPEKFDEFPNVGKMSEAILVLPNTYEIAGEEKLILFNLNFSFTISKTLVNEFIDGPIFCFQKEMMDMIGHCYSNHHSRIGITTFR